MIVSDEDIAYLIVKLFRIGLNIEGPLNALPIRSVEYLREPSSCSMRFLLRVLSFTSMNTIL